MNRAWNRWIGLSIVLFALVGGASCTANKPKNARSRVPDKFDRIIESIDAAGSTLERLRIRDKILELAGEDPSYTARLMVELSQNSSVAIRSAMAYVLGALGKKNAVHYLIRALGDESEDVRSVAVASLESLTGQEFGMDRARWAEWEKNVEGSPE